MRRKVLLLALLAGAALAPQLFAATCQQNYQYCLSTCNGNAACRLNCLDLYNACRYY